MVGYKAFGRNHQYPLCSPFAGSSGNGNGERVLIDVATCSRGTERKLNLMASWQANCIYLRVYPRESDTRMHICPRIRLSPISIWHYLTRICMQVRRHQRIDYHLGPALTVNGHTMQYSQIIIQTLMTDVDQQGLVASQFSQQNSVSGAHAASPRLELTNDETGPVGDLGANTLSLEFPGRRFP